MRSVSISHGPRADHSPQIVANRGEALDSSSNGGAGHKEDVWFELLVHGLTFDLRGLAPGTGEGVYDTEFRYDFDEPVSSKRFEAVHLAPGQHLAGGARSLPVMRELIALACEMVCHFDDLAAIVWKPANSVIGRRYFESVATAWLEGGPFPALGLTSFKVTNDGALETIGLDYWTGQELRIEPSLSSDKIEATRLGARIVNQLVISGKLEKIERVIALDGSRLILLPSSNGKLVRVTHE